ncbi:MAG: DUF4097 domain-containing protein [Vicinamibacterales bacterium]
MKRWLFVLALAIAAAGLVGCTIDTDGDGINISFVEETAPDWRWSGAVSPGKTIEVKGVSGGIKAEPAAGTNAEVVVIRKGRSDPTKVDIEVVEHEGGVTLCAMYPVKPGDEPNVCRPGEAGRLASGRYNVDASFTVKVPAGVHFAGRTINGSVKALDLSGNVLARTVNGSITFVTDGYGQASTVNGSINGQFGRADWTGALDFEAVNGSITVKLPDEVDMKVKASAVNGRITVEYPMSAEGENTRRHVSGVIGAGGREMNLSAVNGSVKIIKASAAQDK